MGTRDPRVDVYIAKSADFAKPILTYIRDVAESISPRLASAALAGLVDGKRCVRLGELLKGE